MGNEAATGNDTKKGPSDEGPSHIWCPVRQAAVFLYLSIAPERMQLVQTVSFLGVPLITTFTRCRLGSHLRFVTLCAWLTLLPTRGCFPQISHLRDIFFLHPDINRTMNLAQAGRSRKHFHQLRGWLDPPCLGN